MTSASWVASTAAPISSLKYGKCQLPTPGSMTPSSAVNRLAVIMAMGLSCHVDVRGGWSSDGRGARNSSSPRSTRVGGLGPCLAESRGPPGELLEHRLGVVGRLRVARPAVLEAHEIVGERQPVADRDGVQLGEDTR